MNIFNHLENELTQLVNVNLKILRLQKTNSLKNLRVEVPQAKSILIYQLMQHYF